MSATMTSSLPIMSRLSRRRRSASCQRLSLMTASVPQPGHLDHEADHEGDRDRGQDQAQAAVGLALFRRAAHGRVLQPITLVAVASSLGGVSKVWNGAGDGTSHSRPSAASQGFCGAFSPLPRIIGTTTKRKKKTCMKPKPKAPI